ncbi:hypothetical protein [Streptomyces sp. NPDC047706]|uniref:hypothetical protein n=1 Tax=Streptomyces sp. NPDC047706 TaxID=3365486 RepID=UPI00371F3D5B
MTTRSSPQQSNPAHILFGDPAAAGEPPSAVAPVAEPAAYSAPVAEPPVRPAPVMEPPACSPPVAGAPILSAPVAAAPARPAPVIEPPACSPPVAEAPVHSAPVAAAPHRSAPVVEPPAPSVPPGEPPSAPAPVAGTRYVVGTVLGHDTTALLDAAGPLDEPAPEASTAPDAALREPAPAAPALDPVGDLVHAAVSDRPLEEIVRLVTLMEQSPEYAQTVVAVLRAVAVDRPVEDVARLIAELTSPPRGADSADETIRVAVERRSLDDVSRLMALLHHTSLPSHCGQEAVRAAATGRPVEELVELIGRLGQERRREALAAAAALRPSVTLPETAQAQDHPRRIAPRRPRRQLWLRRTRRPVQPGRPVFWPSWLAAAALVVCGAAYFPLRRDGAPLGVYALALGMSGVCLVLAVVLALRASVPALMTGMLMPAGLAGAGLLENRVHSAGLSRALDLTVAPPWSAGLTAVSASMASLAALLLLLMVQLAERYPAPPPTAGAGRTAE